TTASVSRPVPNRASVGWTSPISRAPDVPCSDWIIVARHPGISIPGTRRIVSNRQRGRRRCIIPIRWADPNSNREMGGGKCRTACQQDQDQQTFLHGYILLPKTLHSD